jgi:hypothetical protein
LKIHYAEDDQRYGLTNDFDKMYKVSFYCYFFSSTVERIDRYDILWKERTKYLLKHTSLDNYYQVTSDDVIVMIYPTLSKCIECIIGRLRNTELQLGLYEDLAISHELPDTYQPLVAELCRYVEHEGIKSFSIFGGIKKYKPYTAARKLLNDRGIFLLYTKKPHLYLLEDFIREEQTYIYEHKKHRQ